MTETEHDFQEDLNKQQEAINNALNELVRIKAYTLKLDELADFKAAQYALRNLSEEHATHNNVADLYKNNVVVEGDESHHDGL